MACTGRKSNEESSASGRFVHIELADNTNPPNYANDQDIRLLSLQDLESTMSMSAAGFVWKI